VQKKHYWGVQGGREGWGGGAREGKGVRRGVMLGLGGTADEGVLRERGWEKTNRKTVNPSTERWKKSHAGKLNLRSQRRKMNAESGEWRGEVLRPIEGIREKSPKEEGGDQGGSAQYSNIREKRKDDGYVPRKQVETSSFWYGRTWGQENESPRT